MASWRDSCRYRTSLTAVSRERIQSGSEPVAHHPLVSGATEVELLVSRATGKRVPGVYLGSALNSNRVCTVAVEIANEGAITDAAVNKREVSGAAVEF